LEITLGSHLRQMRTARSLSLRRLAEHAALAPSTLSRWEEGRTLPRLPEMDAVLNALNATPAQRAQALALLNAPRAVVRVRQAVEKQTPEFVEVAGHAPGGGDLLRAMRLRAGRTLAEAARAAGVSVAALSAWERGEKWPASERLHTLCFALQAREEELAALTCGRFSLAPRAEAITEEDIHSTIQYLTVWPMPPHKLALEDLGFLTLAAQAWSLAAKRESGQHALAGVYAHYANFLYMQRRFAECERAALRALDILPKTGGQDSMGARAALRVAEVAALEASPRGVARAGETLRMWLPYAPLPFQAWMLSDMGKFESLRGHKEEAVRLGQEAVRLEIKRGNPVDLLFRRLDLARLLVEAGRPAEALQQLPDETDTDMGRHPAFPLARAQAYHALRDAAARDSLAEAQVRLEACARHQAHLLPLYGAEAEALAERL
jgi:transcriptional regulator with XRE-family HTH domain